MARGHRATVVGQYWVDRREEYEQNGVTVIKLPRPRRNKLTRNDPVRRWLLARYVHKLIRERKVDIVETPCFLGSGAFLNCRRHGAVHVLRVHGANSVRATLLGTEPIRFAEFLERREHDSADYVAHVGKGAGLDYLRFMGKPDRPHTIIPNPVDTDFFRPHPEGNGHASPSLLCIGRLDPIKGAFELARALPDVFAKLPDLVVRFAGAESYQEPGSGICGSEVVRRHVGSLYDRQLVFLGRLSHDELVREINAATVCILPSRIEDFPCAVLEAMACGRPVIASSRAHGGEVLVHNDSGVLVDPLDHEQLARAVVDLIKNGAKCEKFGRKARELVVNRCSLDMVMETNIRYYESCLAGEPLTGELLPLRENS